MTDHGPAAPDPDELLAAKLRDDPRYKRAAYDFVQDAMHRMEEIVGTGVHVTPAELLQSVREYALEQFGPLARMVLTSWRVEETRDFGVIVFDLIEVGRFGKSDGDTPEDFANVYEFEDAFPQDLGEVRVLPRDDVSPHV